MDVRRVILIAALAALIFVLWPRYKSPRVLKRMLNDDERRHIIAEANKAFSTSTVAMSRKVDKTVRESQTAWLDLADPIVGRVARRLLKYTDRPFVNCEKLQVVKYTPGGFYKPHQDAFREANKRLVTFIIALTDDYDGGETKFPNLGKGYKLDAGDVLQFACLNNYNQISRYGLHGGDPVTRGTKIIANLWVRKYPYRG